MSQIEAGQLDEAPISGASARAKVLSALRKVISGQDDQSHAMRTALYAFAIRVASAGLAYISQVLMARWIGASEYGVFVTVWVALLLVAELSPLGLSTAAQRFPPHYTVSKEFDLLRGYLVGARSVGFAIASAIAAFGAAGVYFFAPWITSGYVMPLYLACVCLPIAGLMAVQDIIARSYNWSDLAHALPYIVRPVALLFFMWVMFKFGAAHSAETAMYALIGALWLIGFIQFIALQRRLSGIVPKGPRQYKWRDWFRASLPILLIDSFFVLLTSTDVLLLSFYAPSEEVGIYFAVTKTLALMSFISFAVTAASAHRFAEYNARGDQKGLHKFMRMAVRLTFWPSLLACIAMLIVGKLFLGAFGEDYVAGYPLMFILAIGLLARAAIGPVERLLNMLDHQVPCAFAVGTAFAVNLVLNLALIPHYGATGAAIGTTVSFLVETVLLYLAMRRYVGINIFRWKTA